MSSPAAGSSGVIVSAMGTSTAWSAGLLAFTVALTPILHAVALLVSIAAGLLTALWTYRKLRIDKQAYEKALESATNEARQQIADEAAAARNALAAAVKDAK